MPEDQKGDEGKRQERNAGKDFGSGSRRHGQNV